MDYSMSTKFSIKLRGICGELSRIPKVSEEKMFRTFSSGYPKNSFTNIKILPLLVSKKLKFRVQLHKYLRSIKVKYLHLLIDIQIVESLILRLLLLVCD